MIYREAMEELVREGKVKHLGVANFGLRQVEKLLDTSTIKPVVNQIELHPYLSQRKMVGTCRRKVGSENCSLDFCLPSFRRIIFSTSSQL